MTGGVLLLRKAVTGLGLLTVLGGLPLSAAAPELRVVAPAFTDLRPGQTFALDFQIWNPGPAEVVAYDFFVRASAGAVFWLVLQELDAPVNEPFSLRALPDAVAVSSSGSWGAYEEFFTGGFGTGLSSAQTLTFSIDAAAAPGEYTLVFGWTLPVLAGPSLLNATGQEFQMVAPLKVTFAVVPEPPAGPLFLAGMALILFLPRPPRLVVRRSTRKNAISSFSVDKLYQTYHCIK